MPLTLAIDQGTHASRVVLFDHSGKLVTAVSKDVSLARRQHHHVEQDAGEILASVEYCLRRVLTDHGASVRCAGLATQRSTVVAWDTITGEALAPALSWQDTRAEDDLRALESSAGEIHERTGLRLSAHYGAVKLSWLLRRIIRVSRPVGPSRSRTTVAAGMRGLSGSSCDAIQSEMQSVMGHPTYSRRPELRPIVATS